jgi:protein arginine kinase activator
MEEQPDRPLECTECKRPIKILYTEMVGEKATHIGMCEICPVLQNKLRGTPEGAKAISFSNEGNGGLVCGECGTTLETIRMGNAVGCSVCYEVFGDTLFMELIQLQKIPKKARDQSKSLPLHIGRGPGEVQELSPSIKLLALNEALNETLIREDYEQAAWLRDQIKSLTEENDKKNGQGK